VTRAKDSAGPATRAILLVDHGSRRSEANAMLEEIATRVQECAPDWIVRTAHMESASPTIAEGIEACVSAGARELVVHPFFLAPGNHTTHDIPRMVGDAVHDHPDLKVRITEPLGPDEVLVGLIIDRVEACD
jgi:sirohydrochlorin ferrochelatase